MIHDGEAAEDDHVVASHGHVGEVFLVAVGYLLVAQHVHVFLYAEHIDFLAFHLGEDVLGAEPGCLSAEGQHVVGGYLDAFDGVGFRVGWQGAYLEEGAQVGDAAGDGQDG